MALVLLVSVLGTARVAWATSPVMEPVVAAAPVSSEPDSWLGVVRGVRTLPREESSTAVGTRRAFTVELMEGAQRGRVVTIEDDLHVPAMGDRVFVSHLVGSNGVDLYAIEELDRRPMLAWAVAIFVIAVLLLGRGEGLRALVTLAASLGLLVGVLLPAILRGASPVMASALFAVGVLLVAIPLTHGFRRTAFAAVIGTTGAIACTVLFAWIAVAAAKLTGMSDEVSLLVSAEFGGRIDLRGLLLGAIIIGTLGVLDDIAVTQATMVAEIAQAAPGWSRIDVFRRALRVGRAHVGALVNTLALAYVGASLPILLLFYGIPVSMDRVLNRELFATEILRTIVGSLGIMVAVPLTTWAATVLCMGPHPPRVESK